MSDAGTVPDPSGVEGSDMTGGRGSTPQQLTPAIVQDADDGRVRHRSSLTSAAVSGQVSAASARYLRRRLAADS